MAYPLRFLQRVGSSLLPSQLGSFSKAIESQSAASHLGQRAPTNCSRANLGDGKQAFPSPGWHGCNRAFAESDRRNRDSCQSSAAARAAREGVFFGECEKELRGVAAFLAAQQSRHPLFEDLHGLGGRGTWRFADEQMDVVGHEDVANQLELEAVANFAKDANRKIPVFH